MKLRLVLSFLMIISSLQTEARFYCHRAQSTQLNFKIIDTAQKLDDLNNRNQGFIFNKSLVDVLLTRTNDSSWWARQKAAQKISKIKAALDEFQDKGKILWLIPQAPGINKIELKKVVQKLEKLSFILNEDGWKDMPSSDVNVLRDARRSLLYYGIQEFMGAGILKTPFFQQTSEILKLVARPKTFDPVSTVEQARIIALEGIGPHREDFNELVKKVGQKKAMSMVFGSYSIFLLVAVLTMPAQWAYDGYQLYQVGKERAVERYTGIEKSIDKEIDRTEESSTILAFNKLIQKHKLLHGGEEPVGLELEWYRALSEGNNEKAAKIMELINGEALKKELQEKIQKEGPDRGAFDSRSIDLNKASSIRMTFESFPNTALESNQPEDN